MFYIRLYVRYTGRKVKYFLVPHVSNSQVIKFR